MLVFLLVLVFVTKLFHRCPSTRLMTVSGGTRFGRFLIMSLIVTTWAALITTS